jgi:sulfate permease, SulP family
MMSRMHLNRTGLVADAIAGLTCAAVNLPQAMANALLATVNPIFGLYTLMIATPLAALLTGSVFMNVSTTNALSATMGSALADISGGPTGSALFTIVLLAGAFQLALGLARLGWLVRFVPNSVMAGFMNGVAVMIILSQISGLTGLRGEGPNRVTEVVDIVRHSGSFRWPTLAVGLLTIGLILGLQRTPLKKMAMILALAVATGVVAILNLQPVQLVGGLAQIPRSLPHLALPSLILSRGTITSALAIGIVGLVQGAAVSRSYPNPDGKYPSISRDFFGQGVANMATSFFSGVPAGGSIGGTAITVSAGARSRWANLLGGLFVGLIVLLFANLVESIPLAALSGLLIVIGAQSLQIQRAVTVWQTGPVASAAMLITFAATLLVPLQYAVLIGVAVAVLLATFQESNRVKVVQLLLEPGGRVEEEPAPARLPSDRVTVLMIYGSLSFAAAAAMEKALPALDETRHAVAVLSLRGRPEVGSTLIEVIRRYATALRARGSKLMLSGIDPLLFEQLRRTGTLDLVGPDNIFAAQKQFFASTAEARDAAEAWLRPAPAKEQLRATPTPVDC